MRLVMDKSKETVSVLSSVLYLTEVLKGISYLPFVENKDY